MHFFLRNNIIHIHHYAIVQGIACLHYIWQNYIDMKMTCLYVSPRMIGSSQCVQQWFEDHDTCPHCSSCGAVTAFVDVRGMDDMLSMLRSCVKPTPQSPLSANDRDSDFELPNINFRDSN